MNTKTIEKYINYIQSLSNGGEGSGAELTCILNSLGRVRSANINEPGSGYAINDILSIQDDNASFIVSSVDEDGGVLSIDINDGGHNAFISETYVTTVSPAGGTGCTLDITAEFEIDGISIEEEGNGYYGAYAILTGGDLNPDDEVELELTVENGAITNITTNENGFYLTPPTIQVIAGPPPTDTHFLNYLIDFDGEVAFRNERLLEALGAAESSVVINLNAVEMVAQMKNRLLFPDQGDR
jgi:hypothetical protein